MTIARSANIQAMLDNRENASGEHRETVDLVIDQMIATLRERGCKNIPLDDRLAEVEGVISNYLMEAGHR
jgi:hypothetical protein